MVPSSVEPASAGKPAFNRRSFLIKLSCYSLLAFVIFGTVAWIQSRPVRIQFANMRAAEQHIPVLRPLLNGDPRFARIELASYTASSGSLQVRGELDSHEALDDLKKLVGDSHPPVEVLYQVQVITPELRKLMEEFRKQEGTAPPSP